MDSYKRTHNTFYLCCVFTIGLYREVGYDHFYQFSAHFHWQLTLMASNRNLANLHSGLVGAGCGPSSSRQDEQWSQPWLILPWLALSVDIRSAGRYRA